MEDEVFNKSTEGEKSLMTLSTDFSLEKVLKLVGAFQHLLRDFVQYIILEFGFAEAACKC